MNSKSQDFLDRTLRFSAGTIRFSQQLPQNAAGWTIARQIIRSSTSIGANFQEAQYARSRAEFLSKTHIALQEASETLYWLRTIEVSGLADPSIISPLKDEANQLVSILVAITGTTKRRPR